MTLRIITINVNGIRSAARKGFFEWLQTQNADVVCLQETRAHEQYWQSEHICPTGYYCYFNDAEKNGYSGVAVHSRYQPKNIITKLGWSSADTEGRYLQIDFDKLSIASLYMPSGTSGEHRQAIKYEFMDHFLQTLKNIRQQNREYIICGDWNIAHKPIDLKNWKSNQKNSGFLPEERAWLDTVFDKVGFIDAFRIINQEPDQYTWWSNRGRAYEKNIGWRIDYQVITPGLKDKVKAASIYKHQKFSDHAPLIMDYQYELV